MLLLEAEQAKAVSFEDVIGIDASRKEYYSTQFEVIKSKHVAMQVIDKLKLHNHRFSIRNKANQVWKLVS